MERIEDVKVMIINPLDYDNDLVDGKINYLENRDEYISHGDLMINYGIEIYGKDSIFGIMSEGNYLPIFPAFFLVDYGENIVFLNISNKKMGKQGVLYLPDRLSNKQIKAMNGLSNFLKGFTIEINRNLELDDGFVDSSASTIYCDGESEIIRMYKQKVKNKKA